MGRRSFEQQFCKLDEILGTFPAEIFLHLRQFASFLDLNFVILSNGVAIFQNATSMFPYNFAQIMIALLLAYRSLFPLTLQALLPGNCTKECESCATFPLSKNFHISV